MGLTRMSAGSLRMWKMSGSHSISLVTGPHVRGGRVKPLGQVLCSDASAALSPTCKVQPDTICAECSRGRTTRVLSLLVPGSSAGGLCVS